MYHGVLIRLRMAEHAAIIVIILLSLFLPQFEDEEGLDLRISMLERAERVCVPYCSAIDSQLQLEEKPMPPNHPHQNS